MRPGLSREVLRRLYAGVSRRYDLQHRVTTAGADARGRRMLVQTAVQPGDLVLDAGAGTGSTALLAAQRVGPHGHVVLLDLSCDMLAVARRKLAAARLAHRASVQIGDIGAPPFQPAGFDVVLSTYSVCPLYDPGVGTIRLYDLVRPGGLLGVAHSAEPMHRVTRRLADWLESRVWRWPALSMGCRAVSVLPKLQDCGAVVVFERRIGVPLWPFHVFVVRKPHSAM